MKKLFVILGNQLFDPEILKGLGCTDVFMAEDYDLCTYEKHHKLKIYLFLCAMREYRDELQKSGIKVHYFTLLDRVMDVKYSDFLRLFLIKENIVDLNFFEIEDKNFEIDMLTSLLDHKIPFNTHQSPMFMFTREEFSDFSKNNKTFRMSSFYTFGRKKFKILIDDKNRPLGGKWSFDTENRKKIPIGTFLPENPQVSKSQYHDGVIDLIEKNFLEHPGELSDVWFPVKRSEAELYLDYFIREKLINFGVYEDAMIEGKNFLFHSCLSSSLNIGLLTPDLVIKKITAVFESEDIPLNSLEGFIRQVMGWREFIRGIYQEKGSFQLKQNYWSHKKTLSANWYDGCTGILPLDDAISKALKHGYNHHIPRLMVISNIMNLCEIDPKEIYKWFMEMYIDSSEWVMVPNVFGMATYSDGGLMSTKPYTCGSNYILKMSNYKRGEWCDIVDGLYWRFTEKNINFYRSNPRLSFMHKTLERMTSDRKKLIFEKAEEFIKRNTL